MKVVKDDIKNAVQAFRSKPESLKTQDNSCSTTRTVKYIVKH